MLQNLKNIDDVKTEVRQLIADNSYREVTSETKLNASGIYMIYINNFSNDSIVPIYIGQSKNIQTRYKQHLSEILALNRLSHEEYEKYFFSKSHSFYEGKFKSCKIFKYMIENNCSINDFRMVILEEAEGSALDDIELQYFQKLLPSFLGFNQFTSFLVSLKARFADATMNDEEINEYLRFLLEDIKGVQSYYKYGYTRFNFEHSLPKDISYLQIKKEQLRAETLPLYNEVESQLNELAALYIQDSEFLRLSKKRKLLYEDYQKAEAELEYVLDNQQNSPINKIANKILNRIDKKLKNINTLSTLVDTKKSLYEKVDDLWEKSMLEIRKERYKLIFPSKYIHPFSLGDRFTSNWNESIDQLSAFNFCHLRIYISNNGISRSEVRKDPFIVKIDCAYFDSEGRALKKEYFIENEITTNAQDVTKYVEKDYYNVFAMRPERFSIARLDDDFIDNTFISINAEYKHGINDATLKGKKLIKLSSVLDKIQLLCNEETRFNINISESQNCLMKAIENEGIQYFNVFTEKLLTKKLPKISKVRKTTKSRTQKVKPKESTEELKIKTHENRVEKYNLKVSERSNNTITVLNYVSSKENVLAKCNRCDYEWEIRSDHLLARAYCPSCK